jgi:parallel beta-helix repeat protein
LLIIVNPLIRKVYFVFFWILAVVFLSPSAVNAKNLHVDQGKGEDSNNGSKRSPFKTISKALGAARAGDRVIVYTGTYREVVQFLRGGVDRAHMLSLEAAPGADVRIKGSDKVGEWVPHAAGVWKRTKWMVNSQQVFLDDIPLQQIGKTCPFNQLKWGKEPILAPRGEGISDLIPGSFYYDDSLKTLFVRFRDDSDPNKHHVEASVRNFILSTSGIDYVKMTGLKFSHSNISSVPILMGMVNIAGKGWTISRCSFTYGDFVGLNISGEGHRVVNNICNFNGDLGISINGSDAAHQWAPYKDRPPQDILLEGNETSFNNYRGFYAYFQSGGVKCSNSCNMVKVIRHISRANGGPGIWFDIGCRNILVSDCVLGENTRGIEYELSGKALLYNNLVVENTLQGIYVSASDDVLVANNTVDKNGYGIVIHGMPRAEHPSLKNNKVLNNIISDSRDADLVIYNDGKDAIGNSSDYNLYFRGDGGVKISWTNKARYQINFRNLGEFSNETRQDVHSIDGDPRWKNRAVGDYTLLSESPAQGAGIQMAAFPDWNILHLNEVTGNKGKGRMEKTDIGMYYHRPR